MYKTRLKTIENHLAEIEKNSDKKLIAKKERKRERERERERERDRGVWFKRGREGVFS